MKSPLTDQTDPVEEWTIDCQFPYRYHLFGSIAAFVLCGIFAAFMLYFALVDTGDVKVHGIHLQGPAATAGRWVFAVFMAGLLSLTAYRLVNRLLFPYHRIGLTPTGIVLPHSAWSGKEDFVAFTEIDSFAAEADTSGWGKVRTTGFRFGFRGQSYAVKLARLQEGAMEEICRRLLSKGNTNLARLVAIGYWSTKANNLDIEGEWEQAKEIHLAIADRLPGSPEANYAQQCIVAILKKQALATSPARDSS
jgi:hypothetical protein